MQKILKILNKKEKINLTILIFLILITSSLEVSVLLFVQPLLQLFLNIKTSSSNIQFLFFNLNLSNTFLILTFIFFFLFRNIFYAITSFYKNQFVKNLHNNISNKIYSTYLNNDYIFFLRNSSSKLISNILNSINQFCFSVIDNFLIFLTEIFLVTSIIIFLFYKFFLFSLILIFFCFILFFFSILIYRKKIKKIGLQRADADQRKIDDLQKSFHIIQSIKLDGIEDFFINKFNKSSFMSAKLLSIFNLFNDLNKPIWELFILLSFSIAMYVGYNFFGLFRVDLVIIVATFVVAFFRFLPSLNRILNSLSSLKFYYYSIEIIYKDLNYSDSFTLITKREENVNKPKSFSKIKLENISFKYDDNSAFILNQLNLIIEKNSLTFIKGESGAGKSTLLNIICGLLKPTIGEVLLDNKNINLFLKFYRSKIGYVPQKTLLFDDTILDNIALGRNKKDLDLNFIKEVIYKTRLNKLIDKLPNGLNTVIGEKGSFLSGGEQQRIGIARALFKKPEILVLDEATSALDEKTENLLLNEVLELTNDLTIIMVSHKKIKINKKLELFELFDKKIVKI